MSISSVFALIPDRGSVGYSIYQAKLKAKQEAAAAAKSQTAQPAQNTAPAVSQAQTTTETAKTSQVETSSRRPLIQETGLSEEDAMARFITDAKAKYAEAGKRTKVEGSVTAGGKVTSAEQRRANMGNPFVALVMNNFKSVMSNLDGYGRMLAGIEQVQAKIDAGDKSWTEELNRRQDMSWIATDGLTRALKQLKVWSEENGTTAETEQFFAEYTAFTRGERLSLEKLYDKFAIA